MNPWPVLLALSIAVFSFAAGARWERGEQALEAEAAARKTKVEVQANDADAVDHAATIRTLNAQLGEARAKVKALSVGRDCLSAAAVGVLNTLGMPAAASQPAAAPGASATDHDVGDALAVCRTEHGKLADQLNTILDIEDRRHPAAKND